MAESPDLKEFKESLKWWRLKTKGMASEEEAKSALTACSAVPWIAAHREASISEEAQGHATFSAVPGALIFAAINAKCELSLLLPLCLIARLKKRASFRIPRADLAAFIGVSKVTLNKYLKAYVSAGILKTLGKQNGRALRITILPTNRERLIALAGEHASSGEKVLPELTHRKVRNMKIVKDRVYRLGAAKKRMSQRGK